MQFCAFRLGDFGGFGNGGGGGDFGAVCQTVPVHVGLAAEKEQITFLGPLFALETIRDCKLWVLATNRLDRVSNNHRFALGICH